MLFAAGFFYLYALAFSFLPDVLYTARLLSLLAICVFLLRVIQEKGRLIVDPDLAAALVVFCLYAGWVALRTVMTGAEDVSLMVSAAILLAQVVPGAYLLSVWSIGRGLTFRELIFLLHLIIVVQGILIILTFLSWDFRMLTLSLLHEAESNVDPLHPYRVRGLTHNTGAKLAAFQAIGLFLSVYLLLDEPRTRRIIYVFLSVPILLGSILLTGRSGFVAIGIVLPLVVFYAVKAQVRSRTLVWSVLLSPFMVVGGFLLFERMYLSTGGWDLSVGRDAFGALLGWVTQEFMLYIDEGTIRTGTIGALLRDHWFWPATDSQFFFGDPRTWSLRRAGSDIGVVRLAFGAGLVGMLLLYGAFIMLAFVTVRRLRHAPEKALVISIFAWAAIMELKEPYLLDVRQASILAWLAIHTVLTRPLFAAKKEYGQLTAVESTRPMDDALPDYAS